MIQAPINRNVRIVELMGLTWRSSKLSEEEAHAQLCAEHTALSMVVMIFG